MTTTETPLGIHVSVASGPLSSRALADKAQEQLIRDLKVEYFETLDEAYARARELKGPDATLTCIPNGVSVVVKD